MEKKKITINFKLNNAKGMTKLILMHLNVNSKGIKKQSYSISTNAHFLGMRIQIPTKESKYKPVEMFQEIKKYKPIVISTGMSLPDEYWNKKNKKAIGIYSYYNVQLDVIKKEVEKLFNAISNSDADTKSSAFTDRFKQQILKGIFKKDSVIQRDFTVPNPDNYLLDKNNNISQVPEDFTDYIDWKINKWKNINARSGYRFYSNFRNWILKFEKAKLDGKKIKVLNINDQILEMFVYFINASTKEDGTKYKLNYIGKLIIGWKIFINQLRDQDDIDLKSVNLKKEHMKTKSEVESDPYLTFEQLDKIRNLKFDDDEKHLEQIRDLFLVGCSCGYRYSDLKSVRLHKINETEYFFSTRNIKTKIYVKIPLKDLSIVNIFKKYNGVIPVSSPEEFNRQIKTICQRARLKDLVEVYPNDQKKDWMPLYTQISSKACRKTFATNLIKEYKLSSSMAMSLTGHKTEKSFNAYLKLTPQEQYQLAFDQMKQNEELMQLKARIKELEQGKS